MIVLAMDTALGACSAALYDTAHGQILAEENAEMDRGQAEALAPMLQRVLGRAGLVPARLDRIAVTVGPGTFTGLRIGLSLARGMGLALSVPVVGVDTLTATALPHLGQGKPVVVAHLAGGTGKYYAAAFAPAGQPDMMEPMALLSPVEVVARLDQHKALLVGTGLDAILALRSSQSVTTTHNLPLAQYFVRHAAERAAPAHMPDPLYLREPDAKPSVAAGLGAPHVRLANAADLASLARIHAECFAAPWTEQSLAELLAVPGAAAMLVEVAGTCCGFVQVQWVAGEAEINTLCISPGYRRQHLAHTLLEGLHDNLMARGTSRLFLEVAEGNTAAVGLYRAMGYLPSGRRKDYYTHADGRREDAVMMAKQLVEQTT